MSSPTHLASLLAILRAGATVVPLNPNATAAEADYVLEHAEVSAALVEPAALGRWHPRARLVLASQDPRLAEPAADDAPRGALPAPSADSPALLVYTSGTTGRPKGALLAHAALVANLRAVADIWRWSVNDRLLLTLPCFHLHGLALGCLATAVVGSSLVLRDAFRAPEVVRDLEEEAATLFFGVPTMYARLVDLPSHVTAGRDLSGVRLWVSGSAPLSPALATRFRERFGAAVVERFGMSEAGFVLSTRPGAERPGSVGWPVPGVECRIAEPEAPVGDAERGGAEQWGTEEPASWAATGRPQIVDCRPGEIGELLLRGDSLFLGYWRDPVATRRVLVDGWLRTGDLAVCDADGAVRIVGRISTDVLKCRGFKVAAVEIEQCLAEHPDVVEAAVVGIADEHLGQSIVAFVIRRPGAACTADDLEAFLRASLAGYKIPQRFEFRDDLPRIGPGKVAKRALIEEAGYSAARAPSA